MKNIIAALVIILIISLAIIYIIRQKKKGVKCIGCPSGGHCGNCNSKICNSKKS